MRLKTLTLLAATAAVLVSTSVLAGQAKPAAKPATPAPQATAPAAPTTFVKPIRGDAEVQMTKPVVKRVKDEIVTTFQMKNVSATGSIIGLKISEYWYNKGGDIVMTDVFRSRKPVMPSEIITVELRAPANANMASSQYKFEQTNGGMKPKVVPKLQ
jgi:flagellar basal body L-ring protein FlgH